MRKFCKSRGIIPSQESAVEKPLKCSSWPSEKRLVCSETCCLKNEQKKKKNKKPTTSLISFCWVQYFCFSAFRPYFARCCIMQYCGKLCIFLAQIRLKWRGSGVIKRYVLQQWIKRGWTLQLNHSVLYQDL